MYMKLTNVVRKGAVRIAWVILASMPITMLATAAPAAESTDAPRSMVVSFKDLNLSNAEGATALYKRIKRAAQEVCGDWDSTRLSHTQAQICVKDSVSQAVAQVNSPLLTSIHAAKTGKANQKPTLAQAH